MRRNARWLLAIGLATLGAGACSGDSPPVANLLASARWNDSPSTVDETGYQVLADIGWADRPQSCFSLSNYRIRINDTEVAPMVYGDCRFDVLVTSGAFQQDVPITVQLKDGDQVLGQAQFEHLFPGANSQLVAPANGQQVAVGDPVVLTLPAPPSNPSSIYAEFYWLDTPATVPPYQTFATGTVSADGSTFQTTAPAITGHAAVVLKAGFDGGVVGASSCTGFASCAAEPEGQTVGPVFVEVVP